MQNIYLSPHFTLAEMCESQTAKKHGIANIPSSEAVANMRRLCEGCLEPLREALGLPIIITSGYRTKALNNHILHSVLATQAFCARHDFIRHIEWNNNLSHWNDFEYGLRILLAKPVIGYLEGKPRVDVIYGGENSITGTNFTANHGKWEVSLRTMVLDVKNSSLLNKQRYYDLLYYRLLVLAAQYQREGHPEFAKPAAQKASGPTALSCRGFSSASSAASAAQHASPAGS